MFESSSKQDAIIGVKGLANTVTKLGFAGTVLFLFAWHFMYEIPKEREAARAHGERAVERISNAIDRQTQTFIDVQNVTHENQRKLLAAREKEVRSPW